MEAGVARLIAGAQTLAVVVAELAQRLLIIVADVVLVVYAGISVTQDWYRTCDQTLHFYAFMCVMLCLLDLVWETVRCALEGSLDRLQADFQPEASVTAAQVHEGLLGDDDQGVLGLPAGNVPGPSEGRPATTFTSTLGPSIKREKAFKRKWTKDLQAWSIVFSCFVSVIFSFFSAHDEDCAERVPHLYVYIQAFTYVFIFRLGALILRACCRTIKDYEDAALVAGATRQREAQLVRF